MCNSAAVECLYACSRATLDDCFAAAILFNFFQTIFVGTSSAALLVDFFLTAVSDVSTGYRLVNSFGIEFDYLLLLLPQHLIPFQVLVFYLSRSEQQFVNRQLQLICVIQWEQILMTYQLQIVYMQPLKQNLMTSRQQNVSIS